MTMMMMMMTMMMMMMMMMMSKVRVERTVDKVALDDILVVVVAEVTVVIA